MSYKHLPLSLAFFFSTSTFLCVSASEQETFQPWHFEIQLRPVAKARFTTTSVKDSKLNYSDANASFSYMQRLNEANSLSWQIGYSYLKLDWNDNPRFRERDFQYALGSLAYLSTAVDKWRWRIEGGIAVDTSDFDVISDSVGYGSMWGRYAHTESIGLHIGVFAYGGLKSGYALPILGMDWNLGSKWKINAIFPIDVSVNYQFAKSWSTNIAYSGFGGPYRYPRRVHKGMNRYHEGVFEVYSTGTEWNLRYDFLSSFLAFGIGWNYGGWIFIKDHHGNHAKYYKFNGAPYAEGRLSIHL